MLSALLAVLVLTVQSQDLTKYVNPFIGTAIEGYTNPGAAFPSGLSLSPLNTYDPLKTNWARPSPYMYGEEWRTQKRVRQMIFQQFHNSPQGLPGNDDCGTTSACLLFAMMGFYPACPGDMDFQLANPLFDKITITLDPAFYPGKQFVIEARNAGKNNCYIGSIELNGKPYHKYTLNHRDIVKGGKLSFVLKDKK